MATLTFSPVPYAASVTLPAPYPENTTFPLALSPSNPSASLEDKLATIRDLVSTGQLSKILSRHGAIYFKDLGLSDAHEFSKFAHAFGWLPHEDIGNPVRRTILAKNVATANEGPNTQPVYPHNEFGLSPHYPAYVLFYCVSAPESGGETPINNSIVLYEQLKERHPEFIEELEKKVATLPYTPIISSALTASQGVKYTLFYPNGPRTQTSSAGTTVLQAYGQHVLDSDSTEVARAKIEKEIRRLPTASWEWENVSEANPLGDLRTWQHLPAVRDHPGTGQRAFFNNAVSRFLNARVAGTLRPPHLTEEGSYRPPAFVSVPLGVDSKQTNTGIVR
jgi:hypothetical protein